MPTELPIMPKQDPVPTAERELATVDKPKVERPRLFEVLLHNDDYTTQEFVVFILMKFFHHDADTATQIMLHVHTKGLGVAGVYTYEVAETKASQVIRFAREHEMPLQCSIRREQC
jgi:ATP-dependent Clp protease adaptor protein ClpS